MFMAEASALGLSSVWSMTESEAGLLLEPTGDVRRRFRAEFVSSSKGLGRVGTGSGEAAGRSWASGEAVGWSIWEMRSCRAAQTRKGRGVDSVARVGSAAAEQD